MTQFTNVDVACSKCGALNSIALFSSINSSYPHLRAKLLSGEIWVWFCKSCKEKNQTIYPTLYHDLPSRYMIQYVDLGMLNRDAVFARVVPTRAQLQSMPGLKGYRFRLCDTLADFVEKILIATYALDDVAIEGCRPDFPKPAKKPDAKPVDIEFKFERIADGPPKALIFRPSQFAYHGLERGITSSVPFEGYVKAVAHVSAHMPTAAVHDQEFITVDRAYLGRWFERGTGRYIGPKTR